VFKLDGIPPLPRGVPQIDVKFDIDANGIVSVIATDKATNKEQKIVIEKSGGSLSKGEVDRMVAEAKANESKDKERRQQVEDKNKLESTVFQAEKLLKENPDKISEATSGDVQRAIESARMCLTQESTPELIKKELELLTRAMQAAGKEMYESAAKQEPSSEEPADQDDDVVDAEFEEV